MGNTVVWKPASSAMFSAYYLMKLNQAAGLSNTNGTSCWKAEPYCSAADAHAGHAEPVAAQALDADGAPVDLPPLPEAAEVPSALPSSAEPSPVPRLPIPSRPTRP